MRTVHKLLVALTATVYAGMIPAAAQESGKTDSPQFAGHLGISGAPLSAGDYFTSYRHSYADYGSMSRIYADYTGQVSTTGTLICGVDIKFNRVIAVTLDLGVNALWCDTYSGVSDQKTGRSTGVALYFIPMAKIYYIDRSVFRMYGTAGLGAGKYFGFPTSSGSTFKNPLKLEGQLVPLGMEFGKKLFGFAELGAGTIFTGVHIGAGYRF